MLITVLLLLPFTLNAYNSNCWEWVKHRLPDTPPTAQIYPNTTVATGTIAVMEYEKYGAEIKHYAVVEGIFDDGSILISECNMYHLYPSGCGYRIIDSNYSHLMGFFKVP